MGRPREHDDRTAAMLLSAAETIVEQDGPEALSVRRVANDVGTTTRAVYSLFDSKGGLIAALAAHGFDLLGADVQRLPVSAVPQRDLVEAGLMFRRFATRHPSLFRIAFQANPSPLRTAPAVRLAAGSALDALKSRVARVRDAGLLNGYTTDEAALHFHAVCEGLAALELRGTFPADTAERIWRQGLSVVVDGLAGPRAP
jgi:AcrR family transcriptional regulator